MSKVNVFSLFGMLFLSSILLGSGMYSSKIYAQQENEAEVEVDIEQENKCKKDTECENENEINNQLNILTQNEQSEPETPTCETCFTDILSEEQINSFIITFDDVSPEEITTLEQLCDFIEAEQGIAELDLFIFTVAQSFITEEQYNALIQCLQDAGINVDFPQS